MLVSRDVAEGGGYWWQGGGEDFGLGEGMGIDGRGDEWGGYCFK